MLITTFDVNFKFNCFHRKKIKLKQANTSFSKKKKLSSYINLISVNRYYLCDVHNFLKLLPRSFLLFNLKFVKFFRR